MKNQLLKELTLEHKPDDQLIKNLSKGHSNVEVEQFAYIYQLSKL
jgi:hypothetical protein